MKDYAIGDVQGCFSALLRLLDKIQFNDRVDRLWFVGDLVNRGTQSLEVLRFIKNLQVKPYISLGNHDLSLLRHFFCPHLREDLHKSIEPILFAEDADILCYWLKNQSILHYDENLNVVMTHAGIPPFWNIEQAIAYARELEAALRSEEADIFLESCFGNEPVCWSETLEGIERLRFICNAFTRMRFCNKEGCMLMDYKGTIEEAPPMYIPWFSLPSSKRRKMPSIVFGHWAALKGHTGRENIYAIDTGCVWGGDLTAIRLQDKTLFSVPSLPS